MGVRLRERFRTQSIKIDPFVDINSLRGMEILIKSKGAIFFEETYMIRGISRWCVESNYYFHIMRDAVSIMPLSMYASRSLPLEFLKDLDRQ